MRHLIHLFLFGLIASSHPVFAESFSEDWYIMRGKANMKIGNYRGAIEAFEKAHQDNPGNQELVRNLGLAYAKDGLFEKSMELLEPYAKKSTRDSEVLYQIAEICSWRTKKTKLKGKSDNCSEYFERALALDYKLDMHRKYARFLAADHNTISAAVAEYRKVIANQSPERAAKQIESDRVQLRELLADDPSNQSQAVLEYERFTREHPDDTNAKLKYARILKRDPKRQEDAANLLDEVAKRKGRPYDLELERARILVNIPSRRGDARNLYESFVKKGKDASIEEELADLDARDSSTWDQAKMHYTNILKRSPSNRRVRLKYARLLLANQQDANVAEEQFKTILKSEPRNPDAHRGLALAYSSMGEYELALYHSRQAKTYGSTAGDVDQIESDVGKSQRSNVSIKTQIIQQAAANDYRFGYRRAGVGGSFFPSPFFRFEPEAGIEMAEDPRSTFAGGYAQGALTVTPNSKYRLGVSGTIHSMGPGDRHTEGALNAATNIADKIAGLSLRQEYRYDSLTAISGRDKDGTMTGAARNRFLEVSLQEWHEDLSWRLALNTGSVISGEDDMNSRQHGEADFEKIYGDFGWRPGFAYQAIVSRYSDDYSGFNEPRNASKKNGGYFSPQFWLSQSFMGVVKNELKNQHSFKTALGPNVQFTRPFDESPKWTLGVQGYTSFAHSIESDKLSLEGAIYYFKMPDVDLRISANLTVAISM